MTQDVLPGPAAPPMPFSEVARHVGRGRQCHSTRWSLRRRHMNPRDAATAAAAAAPERCRKTATPRRKEESAGPTCLLSRPLRRPGSVPTGKCRTAAVGGGDSQHGGRARRAAAQRRICRSLRQKKQRRPSPATERSQFEEINGRNQYIYFWRIRGKESCTEIHEKMFHEDISTRVFINVPIVLHSCVDT